MPVLLESGIPKHVAFGIIIYDYECQFIGIESLVVPSKFLVKMNWKSLLQTWLLLIWSYTHHKFINELKEKSTLRTTFEYTYVIKHSKVANIDLHRVW